MKKKYFTIIFLLSIIAAGVYIYKNYKVSTNLGEITISKKSNYDASEEIKKAIGTLNSSKKSGFIENVDSESNVIALSFEGLSDKATMNKVIDLLDSYGVKATFFVPGIKAAEDTSIVKIIQKSGHEVENGTLSGTKNMEKLSSKELITDFCSTNKILKTITGEAPVLLKCNSTVYTDNVLAAAYASGNKYVVNSDHYLSYQSFKNYDEAYWYISNLKKATIISIKLEGVLDSAEYKASTPEKKPSVDNKSGTKIINKKQDEVTIVQIVEWLLKSIDTQNKRAVKVSDFLNAEKYYKLLKINNTKDNKNAIKTLLNTETKDNSKNETNLDSINFKELIEKNSKKQATVVSEFYTTQKALAYTFRGISNEAILDKVLKTLDNLNAKATFFVTKEEILKYPDRINKILSRGHEIGNGGITSSSALLTKQPEEICKEIYEVDKLLKDRGINTNAYMPGFGYISPEIKEALSAITNIASLKDYELFTYTKAPIIDKYKAMSAEDIVADYFNIDSYLSLRMGEIVYFRLDSSLFNNDEIIANVIELLTKKYVQNGFINKYNANSKSYELAEKPLGYAVVPLNNLQKTIETSSQLGRYNFVKNPISLRKRTYEDALNIMKTNYIGNNDVDLSDFTEEDKLSLDKEGTINTKGETTIFFTFDDWGGDPVINGILDVLNKHKVNASFFVIAKNADINSGNTNANPNLLRTIALYGNDIGSHNYNHELLGNNSQELEEPLIKSYDVMESVIGDLPSLKPYFRPPSLALKKEGLEAVFESGYKYSISGNITTHDYEKSSAQEIVNYIEQGIVKNKGNIVVMHMNDQAYYTAEALDIFLTNNEKGFYGEKYKIAKLSDYLEQ